MIEFNGKDTKEIYIGDKAISEIYCGDKLVWSKKPKVLDWSKCIRQTGATIKRTGGGYFSKYYTRYSFEVGSDFIDVPFTVVFVIIVPNDRYHKEDKYYKKFEKKTAFRNFDIDTESVDDKYRVYRCDAFLVYDSSGQEKYGGQLTIQP